MLSRLPRACCESIPDLSRLALDSDLMNDSILVERFVELWFLAPPPPAATPSL